MAHRTKHRRDALIRRVRAGRKIKSDLTPVGLIAWTNIRSELDKLKVARERFKKLDA